MQAIRFATALLVFALLFGTAVARGGGGCFTGETPVKTPYGEKPISRISAGEEIVSIGNAGPLVSKVVGVYEQESDSYYEIKTASAEVSLTGEQLVSLGGGLLREARALREGDELLVLSGSGLNPEKILSIELHDEKTRVFNLLVGGTNFFFANGGLVHNKGCFLPDTLIVASDGSQKMISEIRRGERLRAFSPEGEILDATVEEIFAVKESGYFVVRTEWHEVKVTAEHPFFVGNSTFRTAESLSIGDSIFVFDGNALSEEKITLKEWIPGEITVYNLRTDWPNTYFANFMAVHNKGCFLAGTLVETPSGKKRIEELREGDAVFSFEDSGNTVLSRVVGLVEETETGYYEIKTESAFARATPEHPFLAESGFEKARDLQEGQAVFILYGGKIKAEKIVSKKFVPKPVRVFNLRVSAPNTFFAGGFAVHNKGGGCFAAGTKVLTLDGEKAIESLKEGDAVVSVAANGTIRKARALQTFKTTDAVLRIRTESASVDTTAEHPFMLPSGGFKKAGELVAGEEVVVFGGKKIRSEKIISIEALGEETVYNLQVEAPNTFIANGFVVHNKGGGSHGGSGSSCTPTGTDDCGMGFISFIFGLVSFFLIASIIKSRKGGGKMSGKFFVGVFFGYCVIFTALFMVGLHFLLFGFFFIAIIVGPMLAGRGAYGGGENLDYCYSAAAVDTKAAKTAKLLDYVKGMDKAWDPEQLKQLARSTFLKLQECWQAREYSAMQPLLMPSLFAQHLQQIESLKRNHEIDKMDNIEIKRLEIVHLRYAAKKEQQEFTVLFEVSMRDYYVDDRDGKFLRGDSKPETFQEFWVFQRQGDKWLLREINQTRESNALMEENFVEELTPMQMQNIYGELAGEKVTEKASWLGAALAERGDKIHRMLNFLANTDKSWDEDQMKETARKIFVAVFTGLESQDLSGALPMLMPQAAEAYSKKIEGMKQEKRTVEYRNLCVRKVDIVLVKNFNDNNRDEFTARIAAHAQKIESKDGKTVSKDQYVSPFEEYWTFQKQAGEWKLREAQPPFNAEAILRMENIDEESSREQVQWYYTKDRAL